MWHRICRGEYDFNDPVWVSISDTLKDLMQHLVVVDPAKRYSADQFLEHPWFKAQQPVTQLPSLLSRTRSSRYWRVPPNHIPGATPSPLPVPGAHAGPAAPTPDAGSPSSAHPAPSVASDSAAELATPSGSTSAAPLSAAGASGGEHEHAAISPQPLQDHDVA